MPNRFVLALAFAILIVAVTRCETVNATISKVDGRQVTYQKYHQEGDQLVRDEPVTTRVAKDVKVTRGGRKRFEAKKAQPFKDGLADPDFKRWVAKGVHGQITIAEEGPNKGKIIAINLNVSSPPK